MAGESAIKAFLNRKNKKQTNTESLNEALYLFGNKIAEYRGDDIWITNAGWKTVTTKRKYTRRKGVGIDKPFNITSVCKADILSLIQDGRTNSFTEKDVLKLTESDMRRIASKLADDYCEQSFWTSLEIITEYVLNSK